MGNFISEKLYIALDESGKLNKNDIANYFVVGGFLYSDKETVKSTIRQVENEIKNKYNIPKNFELKGNKSEENATVDFINRIFEEIGDLICPIFSVVSRKELNEHFTVNEMLAYDFFVNNLMGFNSKLFKFDEKCSNIFLLMDERNLKKTEYNQLENLLKTNYIEKPYTINTYYLSSKITDVIRLADILDHIVYTYYNNPNSEKNKLFQNKINKQILERIKNGTIYYPFKKSYFKQLNAMDNNKKHD
ncbi:DUF3800 domain-containing protein [Spiroplasma monobiae]|uniref:DUF3800 domain-containing protein n=1 Tax=Spiroplasma monobiae MQ-1 TaxID=1336748 RepID=A0A2K9LV71_SPISQ|nr:DUF3800 domain-containing protein [Spiroplasma monobiae]AUM62939.1 hypothetical protein SMONO_v1c06900 [Spiroplasma monobiae MQ-1]